MAITSTDLISDGSHRKTAGGGRSYTRVYRCISNSASDNPWDARRAVETDKSITLGTAYPDDSDAVVTGFSADYEEGGTEGSRMLYLVTVTYETPSGTTTPQDDPLDDPVQVMWGFESYSEVVERDIDGDPILNSANEKFDPPLERDRHYLSVTIIRNEASFDAAAAYLYIDRVNSDYFKLAGYWFSAREVMCLDYSASRAERNGTDYWMHNYRFVINVSSSTRTGWDREVQDAGFNQWGDAGHTKLTPILTEGEPVTQAWPLNGSGIALTPAQAKTGAAWLTFQTQATNLFADLDLGDV